MRVNAGATCDRDEAGTSTHAVKAAADADAAIDATASNARGMYTLETRPSREHACVFVYEKYVKHTFRKE